jgi:hypothetical protein
MFNNLRLIIIIPFLFILGCSFISCGESNDLEDLIDNYIDVKTDSIIVSDSDTLYIPNIYDYFDFNTTQIEPISINELLISEKSDVIYSARNYLIENKKVEDKRFLRISQDLGKTWKEFENTYGDLVYFHIFSTGDMLFATMNWCYYIDKELTAIYPSQIYDYNGSVFEPVAKEHFFQIGDNKNYLWKIDSNEILVWGDYSLGDASDPKYVARVWYSTDYGHSIRCAIKFDETKIDGKVQNCRHTHGVRFDRFDNAFYIPTGDAGKQCQLIKGKYNPKIDKWEFHRLGSGNNYKFSRIYFNKYYAYMVTDYTTKEFQTGIIRCRKDSLQDSSKFKYLYQNEENWPLTTCEFDMNGNKVLITDGTGTTFVYYARGNYDFKKIPTSRKGWITGFTSPNNNGDVYARISTDFPFYLVRYFNFTESMRNSGVIDYMDIKEPKSLYYDEDFFFNYQYE